ncbi:hypothetical protein MANAM107_19720 [Actinomyces capricornis]|uniref:DUF3039 domain-containing protein n=2 Tax=Actinomyces capricornis TaxID=2755559 RepID=A0ABM7UD72_9ACTO|nr:hypothetical protein MANAM107_19720 [Actinomyces capricornis]
MRPAIPAGPAAGPGERLPTGARGGAGPLRAGPAAYTGPMSETRASTDPGSPGFPSDPAAEPSQSVGTAVLEREELQSTDDGDADRFAHYVRKDKIAAAAATGRPVVALCGKVWTPGRDPSNYPVCPTCKSIYEQMNDGGQGGRGPRFPRLPFGRGGQ